MTLMMADAGGTISGAFHFKTAILDVDTIKRMQQHYVNLLDHVSADPRRKMSQVNVMSKEETDMILHRWNPPYAPRLDLGGVLDESEGKCIHELVEFAAKRTPDTIAVACKGQKHTYKELNVMANK